MSTDPGRLRLLCWNIQWCRGVDGRVDPVRIIETVRAYGEIDVLCLQEVARNFATLAGSAGEDQFAILAGLCPGYEAVEAIGTDVRGPDGRRRQLGNLVLSRLPVLTARRHQLPWQGDPAHASMPRAVVEVLVATPLGPLRILNTHLEYYSLKQRRTQVDALRGLHDEGRSRCADVVRERHRGRAFDAGPPSGATVVCGDFNLRPEDAEYAQLAAAVPGGEALLDAWPIVWPQRAHPPTLGLHDREQFDEPAYCSDYVFVSAGLGQRVRGLDVDLQTQASDHQPLVLTLDVTAADPTSAPDSCG